MHKRISTSIKKNQAEPGEYWPAGQGQSLSSRGGEGGHSRTKGCREEEEDVGQTRDSL